MSSPRVDLSIVIVAWNVRDLVLDCLASLRDARLKITHEVILVDNGSVDHTVEEVSAQFPETRQRELEAISGDPPRVDDSPAAASRPGTTSLDKCRLPV